jgi:hypothetical protein
MKRKPDDYYNNGLFEVARIGNSIIQKNIMSPEVHQQIMDELVNECPHIKDQIDHLVCRIRDEVLMCNPLELLSFAQFQTLGSMVGITSESKQIGMEYVSIGRMAEYIQSILVSCPESDNRNDGNPSEMFFEISKDISDLFILISNYYVAYGALTRKAGILEEDLHKELFEAQLMYQVRGKRYQFIEHEYFEKLLMLHSQEFEKIFHITCGDIIEGINKLQYALSQGRIEPLNELGRMYNTFLDAAEDERESLIEGQRETGHQLLASLFGTTLNDVCSITGWPEQFARELSYGLGADSSFFNHPEYPGWPIIDLPIQKRPFIEIEGKYYCFDYYSFIDNFYRTIQKTVSRLDNGYNWNAVQKEASENMVAELFQSLLPGCTVYYNNYYPKGKSKKQLCENDLLVIYYDVAIIVEVKAGSFVYTAPLVDHEQHIKSYKKLIEEPDLQCKRTYDYLLSNDTSTLYTESGEEKARIAKAALSDVYMLSVTIDNINEFASKAEKLSFLKLQCEAISISVDDLMVYAHYFESPLKFLHFLKQRRAATNVAKLATNDELDHLGLYIKRNCYYMDFEDANDFSSISVIGYREDLDIYFGKLYHTELKPNKPKQELPPIIESIIQFLEKSNIYNKVVISNYLLDFSQDAKEELCNEIKYTLKRQIENHSYIALCSAGRLPTDLRYTCFINQPGIIIASATEQADYVMSTMLWNGDEDRVLLCLEFDIAEEITNVVFHLYKKDEIPFDRTEELFSQGKERAERRLTAYKLKYGSKIGRNEDCPCGSGKKYKKCCGR